MSEFISIGSEDRTSGSVSNFVIKLGNPIEHINAIKIEQVIVPITWYTVMSGINDKIYVDDGTLYTATLTEGVYTPSTLATEMQTKINAAYTPDNNFTVTLSALTYKYTVTHSATNFELAFGTNTTASARKLMGFNEADTGLGLTHTADNIYDLGHNETIFVVSSDLGNQLGQVGQKKTKVIFPLIADGNFGSYVSFVSGNQDWVINYSPSRSFHEIDFKLVFSDGVTEVPLNGVNWRINFLATQGSRYNTTAPVRFDLPPQELMRRPVLSSNPRQIGDRFRGF
jgi:hypothetical protein